MDETNIDLSAASEGITAIVNALKVFVTQNAPVIFSVAGAFIVFWLLRVGVRLIKSFGK